MYNKFLKTKYGIWVFGIIATVLTETLEILFNVNKFYQVLIGVTFSLIILSITIYLERKRNYIYLYDIIKDVVPSIKKIRTKYNISFDFIQRLMKNLVSSSADKLDVVKKLKNELPNTVFEDNNNLHCNICDSNHNTHHKGKCKNCSLSYKVWADLKT